MESTEKRSNSKMKTKTKGRNRTAKGLMELPIYSSRDLIGSNGDLLRQILIHIPEKPLLRFKTVSKIWLNVISDPDFSLRWNIKHPPSPSAIFCRRGQYTGFKGQFFIPLDGRERLSCSPFNSIPVGVEFHCSIEFHEIHQSCNGLLLLGAYCVSLVYNPTTKQLKSIPLPCGVYHSRLFYVNLIFDPSKSRHFKLLFLYEEKVWIYSSETDVWRVISGDSFDTNERPDSNVTRFGVYMNGAIHWPSRKKSTSLYFDVDEECFRTMPMPPIQNGARLRTITYFGQSQGHLHMIDYKDDLALNFNVFEMEKDYSNWFVKHNVNLAPLGWRMNPGGRFIRRFTILSLVGNEEDSLVLVMYVPDYELIISYNLKNDKLKKLCHLSLTPEGLDLLKRSVHQFIRSTIKFL